MTTDTALYAIYAGGALHAGWAGFHLFFPRIFKWDKRLAQADVINQRLMPILNLCLTFYFLAAAYLSFVFAHELASPGLGRKLCGIFAAFWLFRLSLQFKFFNMIHPASLLLSLFFAASMVCYLIPLFVKG